MLSNNHIVNKIINAIDSDDILNVVLYVETNLSKDNTDKLKKMLKSKLLKKALDAEKLNAIKKFIDFLN